MVDALQLPEAESLYVGHDSEHLAAASQRGLQTAAINCDSATPADLHLSGCEDLLRLPGLTRAVGPCSRSP